jgi:cytochrome c peroxidase
LRGAGRSDPQKVALGRDLFFDRRLSKSKHMNCASCHDLATNGATAAPLDRNDAYQMMKFNTPTIFNSGYNFRFGWEGRLRTLHKQAANSLRAELQGDTEFSIRRLTADPAMFRRFRAVYNTGPSEENTADALAAFIATLVTPHAPFDRWLKGADTLTTQQIRGYTRFKALGCPSCHQGANIGGNLFQRRGIFHPLEGGGPRVLRVPSLRNVAVTAPYFHDGGVATLRDAIRRMAYAQLDVTITERDVEDIDAFLRTLTGLYQGRPLTSATDPRQ